MKRVFLILLSIVVVIGVLAGAGFAGYQIGLRHGARASSRDEIGPLLARPNFGLERGPFAFERGFERDFDHGFPHGGFQRMRRGGFGFFGPFMFLGHILFWGLILLLAYWLFTRSGWRLTRTEQTVQSTSPNVQTVTTVQEEETRNE
ncbi:MAG TPA: hypothetical protein VFQ23_10020 [Anaerolineales bacterium]|nr:hypothetical protein [Anaerolineales bacterium]